MTKADLFALWEAQGLALTFDDVIIKPSYSEVLPHEIVLKTRFSRNVPLNIPVASAAMDTVTRAEMAIELAYLGGIGVIDRNLSIQDQASEVNRVKLNVHGRISIENLKVVLPNKSMESVIIWKQKNKFPFDTIPVVDKEGGFIGLITKNTFNFCKDPTQLVEECMIKREEVVSSSEKTNIDSAYATMKKNNINFLPLVEGKKLVGAYTRKDVDNIKFGDSSQYRYNLDANKQLIVAAAVGTIGKDRENEAELLERAERLVKKNVDVIVIDSAHGDSKSVIDTLILIKSEYKSGPDFDVVVGNVSQPEAALRLADNGADGIKVGQGPGSICSTRSTTGTGYPQFSAIYECARAVKIREIPIIGDGGVRDSGDITKAIAAGASSVMLGRALAGADEAAGDKIYLNGRHFKRYRGMGSRSAMRDSRAAAERYNQKYGDPEQMIPEGVESLVPYEGKLRDVIHQLVGGLRSGMGYVGAQDIEELHKEANFARMSPHGLKESHPHDVIVTEETPNYGDLK